MAEVHLPFPDAVAKLRAARAALLASAEAEEAAADGLERRLKLVLQGIEQRRQEAHGLALAIRVLAGDAISLPHAPDCATLRDNCGNAECTCGAWS